MTGESIYSEYSYASPEEFKTSLSHLLERVSHKHAAMYIQHYMNEDMHTAYKHFLYVHIFQNKKEDIYGNLEAYHAPASEEDEIYSQLRMCGVTNISHSEIK